MNDIALKDVLERSLMHFPLYLHKGTADIAARHILTEFKRNGVICEQIMPDLPQRRAIDNPEGIKP